MMMLTALPASAQKHTNSVTFSPTGLLIGSISAAYETQVAPTMSLALRGHYWDIGVISAYGGDAGIRFYAGSGGIDGFYTGAYAMLASSRVGSENVTLVNAQVAAGHKWAWSGGFTLDTHIHATIPLANSSSVDPNDELGGLVGAGFSVAIGYSW